MRTFYALMVLHSCICTQAQAQDTMYIHQHNGSVLSIPVSTIDSIIFYAAHPDTSVNLPVVDADGNLYTSVIIGTQTWMVENLRTTKFKNGNPIPLVTDNTEWSNLLTPAYCWLDNDSASYSSPQGALYNWYAVEPENLCPAGWHVPSDEEWTTLINFLGGQSVAGGKMKETGTSHWNDPNQGATNESGFTAIPGSTRWYDGQFPSLGKRGQWWGHAEIGNCCAFVVYILNDQASANAYDIEKEAGSSVRCLKD